jgi:hypothetical protein
MSTPKNLLAKYRFIDQSPSVRAFSEQMEDWKNGVPGPL